MKKILVTGGSGLIGNALKEEMPDATYVSSKDYNLINENEVEKMFIEHKPEIVIHLAAKVGGIIDNILHPVKHLDDNLLMNTLVLKYAYKNKVNRFITILSSTMYTKEYNGIPYKEESIHYGIPHESIFSYAMVKRIMATQIDNYNKEYGTKYNYIIPCNLYGKNDKSDKIIPVIINKIIEAKKENKHINLFGDGTPIRQFINSKDISKIIKIVIENEITESFNVAPEESYTIDEIAKIAINILKADSVKIKYDYTKPNGQIRRNMNTERFKRLIPNYNFMSLENGILDYVNEIQKKHE